MYIDDRTLAATELTREQLAELARKAVLSEDYEGSAEVKTHRTCEGHESRLEIVRNLWPKIRDGAGEITNLLHDEELRDVLIDWLHNQAAEPEFAEVFGEDADSVIETLADTLLEDTDTHPDDRYDDDLVESLADQRFFTEFSWEGLDDQVLQNFHDGPAYWTIYWKPDGGVDTEAAQKASLVAFEYRGYDDEGEDDGEYLALGGCGMDLSPKIDAYFALVYGRLPEGSQFFSQRDYFEYVVGAGTTADVDAATKLDAPTVVLYIPLSER